MATNIAHISQQPVKKQLSAKARIMEAGIKLMLEQGFNLTSVDDICKLANVSKGSFYNAFETKEELGLAALEEFVRRNAERFASGEFNHEEDPRKKLNGYFTYASKNAEILWGNGCILANFATELSKSHPRVREKVSRIFDDLKSYMAAIFGPALNMSRNPNKPKAEDLAEYYLMVIEGAIVVARGYQDVNAIRRSIEHLRDHVNRILETK